VNAEFINPFISAALSVLNTLLGAPPEKKSVTAEANNSTTQQVNVVCGVTGHLEGLIVLGMRESTACQIASQMSSTQQKFFDSFVASAIGELGNMVCGNAMTNLSETGFVCDITPPTLIHGTKVSISTLDIPAISIHLGTQFGDIVVRVSLAVHKKVAQRVSA
jgi:chemotaxis protein CheX